jgi:hypothetical protein
VPSGGPWAVATAQTLLEPRGPGRAARSPGGGAARDASLDLFVEQTLGAVLGMSLLMALEVGREAGIPAEALVLETGE